MSIRASGTVVSHGVDWITAVTREPSHHEALVRWGSELILVEAEFQNKPRGWAMMGYEGFKCGGVQVGQRDDSAILRLSSHMAKSYWQKAYELCDTVTRLDLEITVYDARGPRAIIRKAHKKALDYAAQFKRGPTVRLITSNDGSDTLYLGQRVSNWIGRVYAKGIESGESHFRDCVRYEVQFNKRLALRIAASIATGNQGSPSEPRYVAGFLAKRGLYLRHIPNHSVCRLPRTRSDLSQALEWIRKSVSPSAQLAVTSGRSTELLEALGLHVGQGGKLCVTERRSMLDYEIGGQSNANKESHFLDAPIRAA